MARLFGTDGVRGRANEDLTADVVANVTAAAARVLTGAPVEPKHADGARAERPRRRALLGRDPRASGDFLSMAAGASLASLGVDVGWVEVITGAGLAFAMEQTGADMGVMITASHNPMPDNGMKYFARGGRKLTRGEENAIEAMIDKHGQMRSEVRRPIGAGVGRITRLPSMEEDYVHHLTRTLPAWIDPQATLAGLSVIVDGSNGAAHRSAPAAYRMLGAEVTPINCRPDGYNINTRCGTNHPEALQRAVLEHGADLGLAMDGDGDRCVAVAGDGEILEGDQILAILALAAADAGHLVNDTVVTTPMSNTGYVRAMEEAGITVAMSGIGESAVMSTMETVGATLGGEQAGSILMSDYAKHGDGILTGLHLMMVMADTGASLHELNEGFTRMPQVMHNIPLAPGATPLTGETDDDEDEISEVLARATEMAGEQGRVLVRLSGTEPMVRVMVETPDEKLTQTIADELVQALEKHTLP